VKGLARLILVFTLCFVLTLFLSSLFILMGRLLDAGAHIPALPIALVPAFSGSLLAAIPATIYITVLLTLSYAVRLGIPFPLTLVCLFLLTLSGSAAVYLGTVRTGRLDLPQGAPAPARSAAPRTLGSPGLILSQGNISMVLLEDPGQQNGPRVVSIPGQRLIYQRLPLGPGRLVPPLPSAVLRAPAPYFLQSILLDFSIAGSRYAELLARSERCFIAYLAAVSLLLCSLGFLFKISVWPLANIFIGALAFRGILAFETFINSREVLGLLNEYVEESIPRPLISALILALAAALILLYSLLARLARRRPADG
jgi:hypothetical protein